MGSNETGQHRVKRRAAVKSMIDNELETIKFSDSVP